MFKTAQGYTIPFPEKIKEEYQIYKSCVRFNLSYENMKPMLLEFIDRAEEPLFFVLEVPLSEDEEKEYRKDSTAPFHKKVCYLDDQSKTEILEIINEYGDVLFNDGISQFAVASHTTNDDFFLQKYNLMDIYSEPSTKYIDLLEKYGLSETKELITPWDTFSKDNPGVSMTVQCNDRDIYDVYDALVSMGLYTASIAED